MFLQDLLQSLHSGSSPISKCLQTSSSALAAALAPALAPSSTLRAVTSPPVSISRRRSLPALALPVGRTSGAQHFLRVLPPASVRRRPQTSTNLPALLPTPDPCSLFPDIHKASPLLWTFYPGSHSLSLLQIPLHLSRPLSATSPLRKALPRPAFPLNLFPHSRHQKRHIPVMPPPPGMDFLEWRRVLHPSPTHP